MQARCGPWRATQTNSFVTGAQGYYSDAYGLTEMRMSDAEGRRRIARITKHTFMLDSWPTSLHALFMQLGHVFSCTGLGDLVFCVATLFQAVTALTVDSSSAKLSM